MSLDKKSNEKPSELYNTGVKIGSNILERMIPEFSLHMDGKSINQQLVVLHGIRVALLSKTLGVALCALKDGDIRDVLEGFFGADPKEDLIEATLLFARYVRESEAEEARHD